MDSPPITELDMKLERLKGVLASFQSCLVAYSGGVDSVFLAYVAHQVLGQKALAVIADSPSLPRREFAEAKEISEKFGFPLRIVETNEFQNEEYLSNPLNRCFYCKHELFSELIPIAEKEGFHTILYGENASDAGDFRPGAQAAKLFEVRAPLKEAGLTKQNIRELSARMGLPTADKPQLACLSSRIPHGESVSEEKLSMIELGENYLRDLGFKELRVRHHELKNGSLARIELSLEEFPRLLESTFFKKITWRFEKIGFSQVTLDLRGYRRGGGMGVAPSS